MNVDSVQTHHGRTTPVIYGVTRANPGTIGIAYMGDGGGLAIGAQHHVNAAVRSENMLVLLCNIYKLRYDGRTNVAYHNAGAGYRTSPYEEILK
jgi:2-oxoglutarate ferredoxin oxidoreductase subunit beta